MIWLLANWRWLVPTFGVAALAAMLAFTKVELADLRLSIEYQKTEAANVLAAQTAKVAAAEQAQAASNAQLEKIRHESDIKTADADSRVRAALARLRQQAASRCGRVGAMPKGTSAAGADDAADGGDVGLPAKLDDFVAVCARNANELSAYVRECHAFITTLK